MTTVVTSHKAKTSHRSLALLFDPEGHWRLSPSFPISLRLCEVCPCVCWSQFGGRSRSLCVWERDLKINVFLCCGQCHCPNCNAKGSLAHSKWNKLVFALPSGEWSMCVCVYHPQGLAAISEWKWQKEQRQVSESVSWKAWVFVYWTVTGSCLGSSLDLPGVQKWE